MLQEGCCTSMLQESHTGMLQKSCCHKEIRWQNENWNKDGHAAEDAPMDSTTPADRGGEHSQGRG